MTNTTKWETVFCWGGQIMPSDAAAGEPSTDGITWYAWAGTAWLGCFRDKQSALDAVAMCSPPAPEAVRS